MLPAAPRLLRHAALAAVATLVSACATLAPATARRSPTVPDGAPTTATVSTTAPLVTVAAVDLAYLKTRDLLIPVAGTRARTLRSSFDAPRDGGARSHMGIDILAPRGTPVLAADDGHVWVVRSNTLGGLTVYTVDPSDRFVFYYAHLDRYRDGIVDGMAIAKGDTLGFVGTTGNAPPDTPHLHFQVSRIGDDHHWWTATPVDPLPYLRDREIALAGRAESTPAALPPLAAPVDSERATTPLLPPLRTRPTAPTVPRH